MSYLIKDLSKLTGVKGFTIRKWQERYGIFEPKLAPNGYWYYSNDDFMILSRIVSFIEKGEKISKIVSLGREKILNFKDDANYSEEERKIIKNIESSNYTEIQNYLEKHFLSMPPDKFIKTIMEPLVILVGRAWSDGLITVADEFSVSRYLIGYLRNKCTNITVNKEPIWLVCVFPGDLHELGALMHYTMLVSKKIPAKFVGSLPTEHLVKELYKSHYRSVSISMTLAQPLPKIEKLKQTLLERTNVKKVFFGGRGYQLTKFGICRER